MASISIRPVSASMMARSPLPREVLVDMMEGNEEGGRNGIYREQGKVNLSILVKVYGFGDSDKGN